ncbi:BspA family leucine-rich repeat surface protein [Muricauda sp. CAU 1633]|uniref:BspA family leucine-rich repeat surface protein n=1 Tax=Allomuricauda sp. CAU 1633 TaxID=2816036 RepID=UPI001A8FB6EA|nr:BspA family leucine-rich repeat surface protein [Muricauda sp. CAU 1633]MBO0323346.1 BspA family leucine-rich repeat surface protein [Muricauda sp. CAU 1633]
MERKKLLFLTLFALGLLISCSKDDGPSISPNTAPKIEAQTFPAAENITDTATIGTVIATDADKGDKLTFSIAANSSNLFEITTDGKLSLAAGKSLDFETVKEHTIAVEVTDNVNDPVFAEITITVTNVIESLAEDPDSFITVWVTTANNESVKIGVDPDLTYDYTIDWGDGTVENITFNNFAAQHQYAQPGAHTVAIKGIFPAILMDKYELVAQADALKLASIEQWGTNPWASMKNAFIDCKNMVYNATDVPNLSQVTTMSGMFSSAFAFNGDLSGWDVSNVSDMGSMFNGAFAFEGTGLSDWKTGNVNNMSEMFVNAYVFNGDLSNWDVSSVTGMASMFANAVAFNSDLGAWDISSVTNMEDMLSFSGLSSENYSNTLKGWASPNAPQGITFNATGLQYCNDVSTGLALTYLTNDKGWSITDGGPIDCN